ncbi:MFS transporter [Amycolatopsis xylanica]|uniref:MFS transporter n=1 Tax=Amycolatopsis xylanica TaxID=589385 RepID=UPI000B83048A|nr:MFS transporter [Amycolatopsis xylanica]
MRTAEPIQRAEVNLVAAAVAVGATGLAAGGTAGPLLAVGMTGSGAVAGLPVALNLAGAAAGALVMSREAAAGRRGRGLAWGFLLGALGALVVVFAVSANSFPLVLAGSLVLGTANSAVFLARYAAAAVVTADRRGRALGRVMFATCAGAVVSPLLLGPGGALAQDIGLAHAAGAYLVAAPAFGCAALVFWAASTPGVPWFGRLAGSLSAEPGERAAPGLAARAVRNPGTMPAILTLVVANFAMVGVMTVAPVHLTGSGDGLGVVGVLVALHVVCMFGPSPLTGYLVDRFTPGYPIAAGGVLLLAGGLVGAFAGGHGLVPMTAHLLLIGLGWNGAVVGGSALLGSTAPADLRTHLEGIGEAAMGVAAVAAAPLAGVLAVLTGYAGMSIWFGVCAAAGLAYCCLRARVGESMK